MWGKAGQREEMRFLRDVHHAGRIMTKDACSKKRPETILAEMSSLVGTGVR
jgi:hypothetical protein